MEVLVKYLQYSSSTALQQAERTTARLSQNILKFILLRFL